MTVKWSYSFLKTSISPLSAYRIMLQYATQSPSQSHPNFTHWGSFSATISLFKISFSIPNMLCSFTLLCIHTFLLLTMLLPPLSIWKISIYSSSFNSNVSFPEIFAVSSVLSQVFCSYPSQSTNIMYNFRSRVMSYSKLYLQWPVHLGA